MNEEEICRIPETRRITAQTKGWLMDAEGVWLYKAAKAVKDGVIVEIGSYLGKSTIWLAKGSQAGHKAKVYTIDPHTGSSEHQKDGAVCQFLANIKAAGVDDIVMPLVMTSEQATCEWSSLELPVKLLFIDGAHEYKFVKRDFELWYPHLVYGGLIAIHDSSSQLGWEGSKRLVAEEIYGNDRFTDVYEVKSTTVARKVIETFRPRKGSKVNGK